MIWGLRVCWVHGHLRVPEVQMGHRRRGERKVRRCSWERKDRRGRGQRQGLRLAWGRMVHRCHEELRDRRRHEELKDRRDHERI